ncbi:hypothetical protein PLESTB_000429900 [Pleodorina starrii]|uniref:Uncharacterized protein n=1 Tax=Pleodorina starrii TaxID=330485 RepID=A0A9W6BFF9_9CHLO|nr:hypothetical protein PLESTM_001694000 [Pleodorina starrii]GLC50768.1 hypothetical protein PLESTB_000429900 [Pleodorina starrii]GLC74324.1 hypothetical protein PLESTF_001499500 [Pleodorina starrii]
MIRLQIGAQRIRDLQNFANDLRRTFSVYTDTQNPLQKGEKLSSITTVLATHGYLIRDTSDPAVCYHALPFVVSIATMHLAALREQVVFSNVLFGNDVDAEVHKREMREMYALYKANADKMHADIRAWRQGFISSSVKEERAMNNDSVLHSFSAVDTYAAQPWVARASYTTVGTMRYGDKDAREHVQAALNAHTAQVMTALEAELTTQLSLIYLWENHLP